MVAIGDMIDAPTVSQFPSIGWEKRPTLAAEIKICQERLADFVGDGEIHGYWCLGNHDMRYETHLAKVAPEYRGIFGVHLKDHFPDWVPCWGVKINDNVMIKHRWGNNVLMNVQRSGMTIGTGHTHRLGVTAWTDYTGTRWGFETGTLAPQVQEFGWGPQFQDYTEVNPLNWQGGFMVLTWREGELLWPEPVHVVDETERLTSFRGEIHKEKE